ncbi:MAG TPA: hypothetical protein DDX89_01165 [Candidatus Omnitrophica bacterium]|nr:hypothetical protein [Candidatus Omnitrophota bacterium]HBH96388.1 hypothetical protein [Candidatus Omnitrophota bacterium]
MWRTKTRSLASKSSTPASASPSRISIACNSSLINKVAVCFGTIKYSMSLPAQIPSHLSQRAIPLDHLGVKEVAWTRKDALEIVRTLEQTRVAILGGDVLQKQRDLFAHNYDNWHCDRQEQESWSAYAVRSRRETQTYLNAYPDPRDDSIAFVLVFGSESAS